MMVVFCLQCNGNLCEICNRLERPGTVARSHVRNEGSNSVPCGTAVGLGFYPAVACFLLCVAPFYCLGWVIGERQYARFTGSFWHGHAYFFGGCVSCRAADSLRFCSFSGERICIILALIFFLPKQRAVRVVICSLHICSIICAICPVVFLYVFIFNFQILPNSDISSLAQISQCFGVHGVSYGQQKPSISFLMTERKHS